ncbi:MAG: PorP/SprF family type IX secretion system membrane protein [Bacteroidia bacterium]|nr:PorP/SprF family type IX secretion system membrane protein [Bacteroidia bacterium]
MKTTKKILSFLIFNSAFFFTEAQDIHFSQFYETPSLLNPALTGATYNLRASLQYKNQWGSVTVPYKTFAASFEMKFNQKNWEQEDHDNIFHKKTFRNLAWGISFFSDKAGDGDMGLTQANFSLASQVPLDDKNSLAVGLQASVAQRSVDYSKLIWPDQYNGSGYSQNINSGENFNSSKFIYGDYAAGLLWTYGKGEMYMSANDEIKANAGVSLYHISQPKESYISNTSEILNTRFVAHGGMVFGIKNTSLDIAPSFMLNYQGPSKEIVFGTLFKYNLREDSKYTGNIKSAFVSIGGYYRNSDAIIPTVLLEIGQYALGVSYDVNVSDLHAASTYRGGIEIMLCFVGSNPFLYENKPRF